MSTTRAEQIRDPAVRLMLAAALPDPPGAGHPALAGVLDRPPEPERLLALAGRHALVPPLYRLLHRLGPLPQPWAGFSDALAGQYHAWAADALRLVREILRLSALLGERGVEHLFFKGPVSAQVYHGDFSLRSCQDIDLLVAEPRWLEARGLARDLGYRSLLPLDARGQAACLALRGELTLQRPADGLLLDLHLRLCPRAHHLDFQEDRVLSRGRETVLGHGRVPTLSHEDQFLHACLHGAKHHWRGLRLVSDPALVPARVPDLDWDRVAGQARRMGLERVTGLALALGRDLLGLEPPPGPARRLAAFSGVEPLAYRVRGLLLSDEPGHSGAMSALGLYLRARQGLAPRLKAGWHLAFWPGPEDLALAPRHGLPLWLARPRRVLRRHGW